MRRGRAVAASKDFWSGAIFLCLGIVFAGLSRRYPMGTAMRMGPAYFPFLLGSLLAFIGLVLVVRALVRPGPAMEGFVVSKVFLVTTANVLFALFLRRLGLPISLVLLVLVAAFASRRFKWRTALILGAGLAIGSSVIFVRLLGVPLPLLGSWLGGS